MNFSLRGELMKYFKDLDKKLFYKSPMNFDKDTDKEILKYSLGANLYMNGKMNIFNKLFSGQFQDIGSITICFEDAIKASELQMCQENVWELLYKLHVNTKNGKLDKVNMPLIFIRVRDINQFVDFTENLDEEQVKFLAGFVFPKFSTKNGKMYLEQLKKLNIKFNEKLYAMPIFECELIIYKETRLEELIGLKRLLEEYKDLILNIRVGGTDFSSKFCIRRGVNSNIYDVRVVSECLIDIVNMFSRYTEGYVISAPVWEYFSNDVNSKEIQGLINELKHDKENGFYGKTIIHPTQGIYVNSNYAVTYEEYIDSKDIVENYQDGGVFKGFGNNKMNEVLPHLNWAKKNMVRAKVFGVLNKDVAVSKLYYK